MPRISAQSFLASAITLIFPSISFAANFTMDPGQTLVVPASQQPTSVFCSDAGNVSVVDKYCACVDPGPPYMKRLKKVYVWSNGQVRDVYFGDYPTSKACEDAKAAEDACQ
jgi:hypothetical protein